MGTLFLQKLTKSNKLASLGSFWHFFQETVIILHNSPRQNFCETWQNQKTSWISPAAAATLNITIQRPDSNESILISDFFIILTNFGSPSAKRRQPEPLPSSPYYPTLGPYPMSFPNWRLYYQLFYLFLTNYNTQHPQSKHFFSTLSTAHCSVFQLIWKFSFSPDHPILTTLAPHNPKSDAPEPYLTSLPMPLLSALSQMSTRYAAALFNEIIPDTSRLFVNYQNSRITWSHKTLPDASVQILGA